MRTYGNAKREEESMEPESLPAHTLASYAQQVSFPNWNTMVGDLGQKFARRSSIEKENPQASVDVEDVTDFLPKTERLVEKATSPLRAKMKNTEGENSRDGLNHENTYCKENISESRKPIFRYCGMIKEDSRESDEEPRVENKERTTSKIHISTVSIVLKSGKGRKRQESKDGSKTVSRRNFSIEDDDSNGETIEEESQKDSEFSKVSLNEEKLGSHDDSVDHIIDGTQEDRDKKSDLTQSTNDIKQTTSEKIRIEGESGDVMGSANQMNKWRSYRSGTTDDGFLTPDYISAEHISSAMKYDKRFRKKSSSFSGNLPLHFQTDKEGLGNLSPDDMNKRKMMERRRGTVDMGRIEPPKSPLFAKENHHYHHQQRKLDPSHYLMHGGKRRGSFNPTYNQYNTTLHKNRKNNTTRAKSLFICNTDERVALRDRLMKHASPELRESLELEDERGGKGDAVEKDGHGDGTHDQRRPLRKSISFGSRPAILQNSQEIEDFYERLKNSENLIGPHRSGRKAGLVPSPTLRSNSESPTTILETGEVETKIVTNNGGLFGDSRFSKPKGRQIRAHSNFAGVPSVYLGRLKDKSMSHKHVTRSQSDSISSASSSEGGESVDPFPMHTAVKNGRQKRLKKLLSKGMDVNARDGEGWPPIHYALSDGNFEIVAILLNAGANITDYTKGRTSKYFK